MNRQSVTRRVFSFAVLCVVSGLASAQIALGTAQNFGVLGGSAVTNTGPSIVQRDVGVSPGSSVTGFPPGLTSGVIHITDAAAGQGQVDLTTAYNAAAGSPCNVDLTGQDLGGLTLTPGVYCFSSSGFLTGTLTLDAQNNPDALFVFKTGSSLVTASASAVAYINTGGNSCITTYWQVGSSATLGTGSSFAGDILALFSITLTTGAGTSGRTLARNGAVTLDSNVVGACNATALPSAQARDIPTLDLRALVLLALLLAAAGACISNRRKS
ncbi:MAG: ice-binding family protein [Betaproteobacteria bacterium]